jgi:cell division protein FtsL
MKRSKRQESSIVIYFSFYFILLLALIIFSLSILYPKVRAIEEKKETTNTIFKDLKALTSN